MYIAQSYNVGENSTNNVVIVPHKCSVLIKNGNETRRISTTTILQQVTDIILYSVEPKDAVDDAYVTWADKDYVSISSGWAVNDYVGRIEYGSYDVTPLTLHINSSTTIAVTPINSEMMPVFCGISSSVQSYDVGRSNDDISVHVTHAGMIGTCAEVIFIKENSSLSLYYKMFNVIPVDGGNSVAVMKYNNREDYAALRDDTPINSNSGYKNGQTITGWEGWYGRWVSVYCKGSSDSVPHDTMSDYLNSVSKYDSTYVPRTTAPSNNNLYYMMTSGGGYNPSIQGNNERGVRPYWYSVLPNCVGYAVGRFNEIGDYEECRYLCWSYGSPNAGTFVDYFGDELGTSQYPSLGACMVWSKSGGAGHVAIVEAIYDDSILVSMSGWSGRSPFWTETLYPGDGNWRSTWMGNDYSFIAFIKNPAVKFNGNINSDKSNDVPISYPNWSNIHKNTDATRELLEQLKRERQESSNPVVYRYEKEVVGTISDIQGMKLLTTPTLVESPFIQVKIGNYTFGSYTREGTPERILAESKVTYPNYMDSLKISKINGAINQYILSMSYQIQAGDDPNLIDKILSSVSDSRKITFTYGDWNSPSFMYRNEEALITKVSSNVDFQQSKIRYTLYCTSASVSLKSKTYVFGARPHTKPSVVIRELLENNTYGLKEIFYGMKNSDKVNSMNLIPSDDKEVDIKMQSYIDILTYLNYLVSCMVSNSSQESAIKDSSYYLIMKDEISGDLDGPYFQIVKVNTQHASISSSSAYEVDIGFPDNSMVLNFQINDDNSWAILYKYAESVNQEQYVYKIDDYGRLYTEKSPNIMMSNVYYEATEANKTWWTKMTQFPISAVLTIKGLVRPSMLMDYVKVNAVFYGQRHASSGLYVITKQEDSIDRSGYKTSLYLTRISGDEDELYSLRRTEVIIPSRVSDDREDTPPAPKDPVQTTNDYKYDPVDYTISIPGVEEHPYDDSVEENDSTDSSGRSKTGNGNIGGGYTGGQITGSDLTPKYEARREHDEGALSGVHRP